MSLFAPPTSAVLPRREEWLREVFGAEFKFPHSGHEFYYEPTPDTAPTTIISGRIGRPVTGNVSLDVPRRQ